MHSVWSSSFRVMIPQWRRHSHKNLRRWALPPQCSKRLSFLLSPIHSSSSSAGDGTPSTRQPQLQLGYDPSEELFGLAADLQPRKVASAASKLRSWFGPNGQYIRELPCPSCRGRGYTPCTECGIERPQPDCSLCSGKGIVTCSKCHGECVIWEESIDEQPWENARSVSPLKVREDDDVDNLDIKLDARRKSKHSQSSDPKVNLKISRSLKSLNAKTGIFSKRMKIIHKDPILHAQRVAAIKKTKGTAAARKFVSEAMKKYFSDPENRRKRSISMKGPTTSTSTSFTLSSPLIPAFLFSVEWRYFAGIKFYCRNCGCEGHRRNYCPEVKQKGTDTRFTCRLCGQKGHNRRTCPTSNSSDDEKQPSPRHHRCTKCGLSGHNRRTCPQVSEAQVASKRNYTCKLCHENGHNVRTCQRRTAQL